MSVKTAVKQPEAAPLFDEAQQAERREGLRRAQHENWLEGIEPNAASDHIREAYVRGEINAENAIQAWKDLNGVRSWEETQRRLAAGEKVPGYS